MDDYKEVFYTSNCDCGIEVEVSTWSGGYLEGHTQMSVKCQCGEWVGFSLPIN